MKKFSLLLMTLLICSCSMFGKSREFKVLELNIWQEGTMVEGGFDAIADEIKRFDPDFVQLSEIRNYNGIEFIPRILKALEERGVQYYGETGPTDTGTLSKYPIQEQGVTNYEGGALVLKSRVEHDGHTFIIYSAHIDYTHYACYLPRGYSGVTWKKLDKPVTDSREVEKANNESWRDEAIKGVIEDAKKEEGNIIILAGDFNEPSHLDWTEKTKDLWEHNGTVVKWDCSVLLEKAGFKDAYRVKYPNPVTHPGFTFPSDNKDKEVARLSWAPDADERDRIDYVYYVPNKKLKLVDIAVVGPSSSIVRSQRVEEQTKDKFIKPLGVWPSDHKGLIATFKLKY